MNPIFSAAGFAASAASAYLCGRRMSLPGNRALWWICFLVLWTTFLLVPVHLLAALQILGLIRKVTIEHLAWFQMGIAAGILGLDWSLARHPAGRDHRGDSEPQEPLPVYAIISTSLVGATYLFFAINLCTSFPTGADALNYHIPLAVRWLQQGSLQVPVSRAWRLSLPGNGEILMMLALACGRQWLAPLFNWISCVVLTLSLYLLARKLTKCKRTHALVIVLIALSIPIVQFQTFSAYVDLFGAAFILGALVLFLHRNSPQPSKNRESLHRRLSIPILFLSTLACGISLGAKPVYYVYCAVFFVWILITLWRERSIHQRPMSLLIALLLSATLLLSAFWFVRDWEAFGNPIYPLQVKVGRHIVFPGYQPQMHPFKGRVFTDRPGGDTEYGDNKFVRRRAEWLIYPWTEWLRQPGYFPTSYDEDSGFGGAFATLIPFSIAVTFYQGRGIDKQNQPIYLLLLTWLAFLALWVLALHRVLRFGFPVWTVACVFTVPMLRAVEARYQRAFGVLLILSLAATLAITSLVPFHALLERVVRHRSSRAQFYRYPSIIDTLPAGSRVLNYTGILAEDFALSGKMLNNRVIMAIEAPEELTQDYVTRECIDYVVDGTEDSPTEATPWPSLPASISALKIYQSDEFGVKWSIYEVNRQPAECGNL
jgi:hypothetical protein